MPNYQSYLNWITNEYSTMIKLVEKWTLINSWSENVNGLQKILKVLEQDFKSLNGHQKIISLPPRQVINHKGQKTEKPMGQALAIKKRPEAPIQIFLGGHMDTVYPPSETFQSVQIEKDTIRGPGVTDMKGGLVILLKTLEALEQAPFAKSIGWEILINPDEEIGSPGSHPYFIEAAKRNHIGLIFEPSLPDGALVSQRKGTANFTVVVKGRAAHSGRDFYQGRSAIYAIAHLIQEFEKLNNPNKDITVNIGSIEGGGAVNIVPDLAICKINLRAHLFDDMIETKEKMSDILYTHQKREGITCTLFEDSIRSPKILDTKTQHLLNLYGECAKRINIPFHTRATGGACDGNILSSAGLPTLDSLGAVGGNIHTTEEYLISSSLIERTQLATLFLLEIAFGNIVLNQEPP